MNYKCRIICRMLWCLATLLLGVTVTSCSDIDDTIFRSEDISGATSGLASVSYTVDGMSYQTRSSVVASSHETELNHVNLIFFSSEDDSYITNVQAQVITNHSEMRRTFSFSIPKDIHQQTDYKVLAIGNGDYFVPRDESGNQYESYSQYLDAVCPDLTLTEARNTLQFYNPQPMSAAGTPMLPMYGELINSAHVEIPFNYEIDGDNYKVTGEFYFKRAVSRIDFTNLIPDKLDVDYIKMVNIREGGLAYQDGKNCGDVLACLDGEDFQSPSDGVNGWVRVDNNLTEGQEQLKASLYAFPNIVASTGTTDQITTALLIAGRYGTDTGLTYYRFNLAQSGEPLSMLRNHIYTVIAKNITGRGDATEEEAMRREKPVLTSEVVEDWSDDTSVTTDSEGNFLILSRTTVTLEGVADEMEVIQVKVNEGTTWRLEIVEQTGHNNEKFEMKPMGDGESFYVKTLEDNTTYTLRRGFLNIVATTPQGGELKAPFIVQQVPNEEDPRYLLVENNSTNYITTVAGVGGTLNLQIETGSLVDGWFCKEVKLKSKQEVTDEKGNIIKTNYEFEDEEAVVSNSLTNKFKDTQIGTYTSNGGHMGHLIINLNANITKEDREIYLKVERDNASGENSDPVDPVYVIINQPKSEYLISIFPYPENGTLYIEGFDPDLKSNGIDISNGISAQEEIFVSLADPDNYTFEVSSTFDYYRDLRLSANAKLAVNTTATHYYVSGKPVAQVQEGDEGNHKKLSGMTNGQKFFINVFRTGPGDPDIGGEITVRAIPKNEEYETQEIQFHVIITTSCKLDEVLLPYGSNHLLVADRNIGAKSRLNDSKGFVPALNYSANPYLHISGYGDINHTDDKNHEFMGELHGYMNVAGNNFDNSLYLSSDNTTKYAILYKDFTEKNLDDDELYSSFYKLNDLSWRIPTNAEWNSYIYPRVRWSKHRAFLLSDVMDKNGSTDRYIGCFLPLNESSGSQGTYWTAKYNNTNSAYFMKITDTYKENLSATTEGNNMTTQHMYRAVRTVSTAELNYYKTKFLGY